MDIKNINHLLHLLHPLKSRDTDSTHLEKSRDQEDEGGSITSREDYEPGTSTRT